VKLNQIVAIERDLKKSAYADLSKTHHLVQRQASVLGESGVYTPAAEDGVGLPPESRLLQTRVEQELLGVAERQIPYWDLVATKDQGNTAASATVTLPNGQELKDLPVPTLLFLEKQLQDLRTFFEKLPVLDPDQTWVWSEAKGAYVTEPINTVRTAKIQKPVVLVPPTKEHPAQSVMVTEDVVVGTWSRVKMSGAITEARRNRLVKSASELITLVKQAREAANLIDVEKRHIGATLFDYLLHNG
jgi:hypothetical protein